MSERSYQAKVRGSIRGLWSGVLSVSQFEGAMEQAVSNSLIEAWEEGAAECGITLEDLTDKERAELDTFIKEQLGYIVDFGEYIEEHSQANDGRLQALYSRGDLWVNRYSQVKNQARTLACEDIKLKWVINARGKGCKEHCRSCLGLNGKVKRASYWEKADIRPQSNRLECGGWRCCCSFMPTNEPVSRGKLPAVF